MMYQFFFLCFVAFHYSVVSRHNFCTKLNLARFHNFFKIPIFSLFHFYSKTIDLLIISQNIKPHSPFKCQFFFFNTYLQKIYPAIEFFMVYRFRVIFTNVDLYAWLHIWEFLCGSKKVYVKCLNLIFM